jgi:hypothetical protein
VPAALFARVVPAFAREDPPRAADAERDEPDDPDAAAERDEREDAAARVERERAVGVAALAARRSAAGTSSVTTDLVSVGISLSRNAAMRSSCLRYSRASFAVSASLRESASVSIAV